MDWQFETIKIGTNGIDLPNGANFFYFLTRLNISVCI